MSQHMTQLSLASLFVWSAIGGIRTSLQLLLGEQIIPKVIPLF